jgi:hypothetical protein
MDLSELKPMPPWRMIGRKYDKLVETRFCRK